MCALPSHVPIIIIGTTNLSISRTFVGTLIFLKVLTFGERCITPWLLTQKSSYLVSVCPKNDFDAFTFNPDSANFYDTFSKAFKLFLILCVV